MCLNSADTCCAAPVDDASSRHRQATRAPGDRRPMGPTALPADAVSPLTHGRTRHPLLPPVRHPDRAAHPRDGGPPARRPTLDRAREILLNAGQFRCHCVAVLGLCSVATGDGDGYVHVSLRPWDYAAGLLLAEEAGGTSSDLSGHPLQLFGQNDGVLVSNGHIHEELLAYVTHVQ